MICGATEKCAISAAPISMRPMSGKFSTPTSRSSRCRRNIRSSTTVPNTASPRSARPIASASCATGRSPADSCPTDGSARRSRVGPLANRSLTKYKLIIDEFGGWPLFQELLAALRRVADRHGARCGDRRQQRGSHADRASPPSSSGRRRARIWLRTWASQRSRLTPADHAEIAAITSRRLGPKGDVYELERDRGGRHGSIMKYNLSAERV